MPALAAFLSTCFGALLSLLGRFFVLEKASRIAAATLTVAAATALVAFLYASVAGLSAGIAAIGSAHPMIGVGIGLVINPATLGAISIYMAVWVACQVYVVKKRVINMVSGGG